VNEVPVARDPLAVLSMLQLGDNFFPSGLYTLSQGLESLVQSGQVRSLADLESVIETYAMDVVGPSDAVAAAEALRASAAGDLNTVLEIDQRLLALKLTYESRMSSQRTGRRLLVLATGLTTSPQVHYLSGEVRAGRAPGNYAVALGVTAEAFGLDPPQVALVELYATVTSLLGAALRCLRIDHAQVQSALRRLLPVVQQAASAAIATPFVQMRAFAPAIEIAQMQHERAGVRLFAS
jgi:urease accessory protein